MTISPFSKVNKSVAVFVLVVFCLLRADEAIMAQDLCRRVLEFEGRKKFVCREVKKV